MTLNEVLRDFHHDTLHTAIRARSVDKEADTMVGPNNVHEYPQRIRVRTLYTVELDGKVMLNRAWNEANGFHFKIASWYSMGTTERDVESFQIR